MWPSGSLPRGLQHPINPGQTRVANRFQPGRNENHKGRHCNAANFNEFLERIHLGNIESGTSATLDIKHVFMMAGADPNTEWLQGSLALDTRGFIKTGSAVQDGWPQQRNPYPLETSLPGVFAVGDIRAESVKRVAAAVGEGSMAVQFVHKVLAV